MQSEISPNEQLDSLKSENNRLKLALASRYINITCTHVGWSVGKGCDVNEASRITELELRKGL